MTFAHSLSQIPSEKQIMKHLKNTVFGKRVHCPDCHRQMYIQELEKNRLWRCRRCRNKFSLTSVAWLRGMKLSYQHLWCLIWCWQHKMNVQQVQDLLNLSIPTIRRYYALFRDNLQLDYDIVLEGKVQMDEMFVKGAFVIGAKDIARKKIKLVVVRRKSPTKGDAMELIMNHIRAGSTLQTDGGSIYRGCENFWPLKHKRDIHRKFQFALTSEIEGVWANFRTFVRRMYHHITVKYLAKTVAEFEARFSRKELFESPLAFIKNSLCPVTLAL